MIRKVMLVGLLGLLGCQGKVQPLVPYASTDPKSDGGSEGGGVCCVAGAEGPQGPVGTIGPTGSVGARGETGLQGIQGVPGLIGDVGPKGDIGPQGLPGIGVQGPQGIPGQRGAMGPAGLPGLSGGATAWYDADGGYVAPGDSTRYIYTTVTTLNSQGCAGATRAVHMATLVDFIDPAGYVWIVDLTGRIQVPWLGSWTDGIYDQTTFYTGPSGASNTVGIPFDPLGDLITSGTEVTIDDGAVDMQPRMPFKCQPTEYSDGGVPSCEAWPSGSSWSAGTASCMCVLPDSPRYQTISGLFVEGANGLVAVEAQSIRKIIYL